MKASRTVFALGGSSLLLGIVAWALVQLAGRRQAPPVLGSLPAFELTERSGRTVTLSALQGGVWVADFIFTRCGSICPAMTSRMARLRRELPPDVRLVSFTVDPDFDSPQVLTQYASQHGAGENWWFLTGDRSLLARLAIEGFRLEASPGNGPDLFVHSTKFALVDAQGRLRGHYDSGDEQAMTSLVRDLQLLRADR